jgi:murein DD-endopeptidase MepM/ murein hydrolase activator NlpD
MSRRRNRRALLVGALVLVAAVAAACVPPTPPAPQATITHCPLDSFKCGQGFSATHGGEDLIAPLGPRVYAVRNGTIWYYSKGDVGGYSAYLKADDGNTYYYTHLTPYPDWLEGLSGPVKAGDEIEQVNHTGNANGLDHLHFEVRLGGPNGTKVDPWPVLAAAGCEEG